MLGVLPSKRIGLLVLSLVETVVSRHVQFDAELLATTGPGTFEDLFSRVAVVVGLEQQRPFELLMANATPVALGGFRLHVVARGRPSFAWQRGRVGCQYYSRHYSRRGVACSRRHHRYSRRCSRRRSRQDHRRHAKIQPVGINVRVVVGIVGVGVQRVFWHKRPVRRRHRSHWRRRRPWNAGRGRCVSHSRRHHRRHGRSRRYYWHGWRLSRGRRGR